MIEPTFDGYRILRDREDELVAELQKLGASAGDGP